MSIKNNIKLNNLSIGYISKKNKKIVAKNITAEINSGELTCILGANGIGKSTLLKTLCAFQPKIEGDIYINNIEISKYTPKELAQLVSVVLTNRTTIHNMSSFELISLGRSPYTDFWGKINRHDKSIIDKAIKLVNIEELSDRMINTLSDGERQKVMITKALVQETPIILLDEPTSFLDFPSKVEIMQLLHKLSRETDKTIFLSTHDMELALQIADKIWLLEKDSTISIGIPEDLSLSGKLTNFFSRKGIIFDNQTGLFRIENSFNKKIKLIGQQGIKKSMIKKALLRNNILASEDANTIYYIDSGEKGNSKISFHNNKEIINISNIEELLNIIKLINI